jgi:tetratricopeptide (TPR) repeat protein
MRAALLPDQLFQQALALHHAGDFAAAERLYRQVLADAPAHADSLHLLGLALHQAGRSEAALEVLAQAIRLRPNAAEYHESRGHALLGLKQAAAAVEAYRRAVRLNPASVSARINLGWALAEAGEFELAANASRQALRLDANQPLARLTLGRALHRLALRGDDCIEAAVDALREAVRLAPGDAEPTYALGYLLHDLGRTAQAEACLREAIRRQPGHAKAHFTLAALLLATGRLQEGWAEWEWRWGLPDIALRLPGLPWCGEAAPERVLLVYHEQGLGDFIQFCRFLPAAAARVRVVVEARPSLERLIAPLPGVERVVATGTPEPPAHDFHCGIASLARPFVASFADLPVAPYLRADPAAVQAWRQRLAPLPGLRVGLAWAGSATYAKDRERSIPAAALAALSGTRGVSWVSLQKERTAASVPLALNDWTAELADFADTAALIAALDLVVSVDTVIAHLAGALGHPVWLLNRFDTDWRWLREREDSPWYPSLRIFRQARPGDWNGLLARLRTALQTHAAERS